MGRKNLIPLLPAGEPQPEPEARGEAGFPPRVPGSAGGALETGDFRHSSKHVKAQDSLELVRYIKGAMESPAPPSSEYHFDAVRREGGRWTGGLGGQFQEMGQVIGLLQVAGSSSGPGESLICPNSRGRRADSS